MSLPLKLIASKPTHANDLARRIATLLRDSVAPLKFRPLERPNTSQPLPNQVTEYSGVEAATQCDVPKISVNFGVSFAAAVR
jgi:hypothetical protein